MSREKGSFLDAFYNTPSNHKDKNEVKQKTKVVTYSLKEDNVKYVELRSTHFGSKYRRDVRSLEVNEGIIVILLQL